MSSNFLFLSIFFVLVTIALAQMNCYYGQTVQNGNAVAVVIPITPQYCPQSYYCQKNYLKYSSSSQQNSYGCGTLQCSRSGCTENSNGYGTCCCRGNYCNSGFDFSKTAFSSIILTLAVSVYYMCF